MERGPWPQGSGRGRRAVGVAAGQWAWPQGRGRSRAATSAGSFSQYCSVVPRGRPENACWIHEEDERSPWHLTPLPPMSTASMAVHSRREGALGWG